jgi:hypothetical protein
LKRTGLSVLFAIAVMAVAVPSSALAGDYTLHPNGFGEHSYSAWKAQQGEADSHGASNQALYFQKFTTTATIAAGFAVIDGFEGETLEKLAFDWRMDGRCGPGAPRFNVTFHPAAGPDYTLFFGCAEGQTEDAQEPGWERRSFEGPFPPDPIAAIAIVFDEGNDIGQGFVYLDNIQVNDKIWTSAADNGNG